MSGFDLIVVGAGLRGMGAALRAVAERPDAEVLVVEKEPSPGGDVRTQRSNGFVCELGPFAFTRDEVEKALALIARPPRVLAPLSSGRTGWLFDGAARHPVRVEPEPLSFPTGCEDVVQACRRQLGERLRLGRAVTRVAPRDDGGFDVELGGEVPSTLHTREVVLAVPPARSSQLLGAFEPELPSLAQQLEREPRAYVFFGGVQAQAPELTGFGVMPVDGVDATLAEVIFCTEVFESRAMPGRCLVRAEPALEQLPDDDRDLTTLAERELRRWTGTEAPFGFTKVHRFWTTAPDGAAAECRVRVAELARRVPGMSLAP